MGLHLLTTALIAAATLHAGSACSQTAPGAGDSAAGVTTYPASFFASARSNTAFDMIDRLPGFVFDPGESVRGFAGAAGNVLINGQRPSTKADSLDEILRRIPASSVARIELIRGGAPGIDMQGRTVLANIILKTGARTERTVLAAVNAYGDGRIAPTVQIDVERQSGERSVAGSIKYYYEEGDLQGNGAQLLRDASGLLTRAADAQAVDIDKGVNLRGSAQTPWFGGTLHLNGALDFTKTDQFEQELIGFPPSGPASESTSDHYRGTGGEIGGDYTYQLGGRTELKLVALQSLRERTYTSQSDVGQTLADFAQTSLSGESILRGTATYTRSNNLSFEAGAEGAFNFLDGRSSLLQDGTPVALPNARVLVEERRGEVFGTTTWRISKTLNLEAGSRVEVSTISQSGDTQKSASFFFPKPRAVLTWSPNADSQVRLRIEREVGQLDFLDFVANANLSTGVVSAGNANLEPERRWVFETALERRFWGAGDAVLTLSHEQIEKVIDQVPIAGLNAPGNIGDGRREVAEFALTIPLAKLGLKGGFLKTDSKWIFSQVTDPTTGGSRMISGDQPFSGSVELTNDMPRLKSTWTISVSNGFRTTDYRIDEIETDRYATEVDLSWEYKPSPGLTVLAQLTNITGRERDRFRTIYGGLRSDSPIASTEQFQVSFPPSVLIRVRKSW